MRVLEIAESTWPEEVGGTKKLIAEFATRLRGRGHDVRILLRAREEGKDREAIEGVRLHRYRVKRTGMVRSLASEIVGVGRALEALRGTWQPEILLLHHPIPAFGAIRAPLARRTRLLYVYHAASFLEFPVEHRAQCDGAAFPKRLLLRRYPFVLKWIQRRGMQAAHRVLCFSEYTHQQAQQIFGIPSNKIVKMPVGVDLDRFRPIEDVQSIRRQWDIPEEGPFVLTVRRLHPRMGLAHLVEAFATLLGSGAKAFLGIAGRGPLMDELQGQIDALGASRSVRLLGYVAEERLPSLYAAADLFVMPTECLEGYGLAGAEALACGVPVLGTPVGAIPELVSQLAPDLVCSGWDAGSLSQGLIRILSRPDHLRALRTDARWLSESISSWDRSLDVLESAFVEG